MFFVNLNFMEMCFLGFKGVLYIFCFLLSFKLGSEKGYHIYIYICIYMKNMTHLRSWKGWALTCDVSTEWLKTTPSFPGEREGGSRAGWEGETEGGKTWGAGHTKILFPAAVSHQYRNKCPKCLLEGNQGVKIYISWLKKAPPGGTTGLLDDGSWLASGLIQLWHKLLDERLCWAVNPFSVSISFPSYETSNSSWCSDVIYGLKVCKV